MLISPYCSFKFGLKAGRFVVAADTSIGTVRHELHFETGGEFTLLIITLQLIYFFIACKIIQNNNGFFMERKRPSHKEKRAVFNVKAEVPSNTF